MFFINSTCHQFFFFFTKGISIIFDWSDWSFPYFEIIFLTLLQLISSPVNRCMDLFIILIMYDTNILQCIIIPTSHHMLCIVGISPNFLHCQGWQNGGIHKICEAQIKQHLQQYTILFSNFLKLDSSFPKNINMNFHIKGRISSLWKINHVIL